MRLVSPEEAQSLFAAPLFCDECSDWMPWNLQPTTVVSTAGVMKEDGSSAMLIVELLYTRTHKTKKIEYRFTVFRRQIWGNDPVYQLHIRQSADSMKHLHSHPHEHIGNRREAGDASWMDWGYDEVLAFFCKRTNITFRPPPCHPEHFALKS
ncbi:hypothetical protein LXA47_29130 [Massilia sp. P8910]|uniref:hypothetical protein n=1 Tax=Massilia antarctica TaxID=2765360 RepID=UPI001E338018|nr:hypothetical protein [Massilia antarctica]MCE3607639.1 hypothetical protein [Massilia antarctica]